MFIINKKRISIILMCILLSIFVYSYQKEKINIEVEKVTTTPISGKTIILDAGHGSPDEGAEGKTGVTEAQINLKIVLKVQNLLEQNGCTVILTRSDSNSICNLDAKTLREKKISDIKNRVEIGNNTSADAFISIHLNKLSQKKYFGWQCFYKENNEESKKLSKLLQKNLNQSIKKENNRVAMKINNIYIVKKIEIPLAIVECGFLSNEEEELELQQEEYQDRLAWGIYNGIMEYFYK